MYVCMQFHISKTGQRDSPLVLVSDTVKVCGGFELCLVAVIFRADWPDTGSPRMQPKYLDQMYT